MALFQLGSKVVGVAVMERHLRPTCQAGGLEDAVMGTLVNHDQPGLGAGQLRQNVVAHPAGSEIERIVEAEHLGRAAFDFQQGRRRAESGARVRAADSVSLGGFAGGADHLGAALKAEIAGAREVEILPTVDSHAERRGASR